MQLKYETILLLYAYSNETVACRVQCQLSSVNAKSKRTSRNLTDDQWQLFDNCIGNLLNSKAYLNDKTNHICQIGNIVITIKESSITSREIKKLIHEYEDLTHCKIKFIWDCSIVVKETKDLIIPNIYDENIQEYEPLALHANESSNKTYKPSKVTATNIDDLNLKKSSRLDSDDVYQPETLNSNKCTTSSPEYKPSPIKRNKKECPQHDDAFVESQQYELSKSQSKGVEEMEYIPSSKIICDNKSACKVPEYIPTPISNKKSETDSSVTIKHLENKRNDKARHRNHVKTNSTENTKSESASSMLLRRPRVNPDKIKDLHQEQYNSDRINKRKPALLRTKHRELFGSDEDEEDNREGNLDIYSNGIPTNSNLKSENTRSKESKSLKVNDKLKSVKTKSNGKEIKCVVKNVEYVPTKEDIKKMERLDRFGRKETLECRKKSSEANIIDYLTLRDMTLNDIMNTFKTHKSRLDEIYVKCCNKDHIKSFNGLNHCFVFNLIEEKMHTRMLQKLSETYNDPNTISDPTMFANALLPEWLIRIFINKYQLSRQQAVVQIKAQEIYRLENNESESFLELDL